MILNLFKVYCYRKMGLIFGISTVLLICMQSLGKIESYTWSCVVWEINSIGLRLKFAVSAVTQLK